MDTVKSKMVNFIATNIPGTASLIVTVKKWDIAIIWIQID